MSGEDSVLTLLLLMSKYGVKSVPVVESGKPFVQNMITQSSVIKFFVDCDGLNWFDRLAGMTLEELSLPVMTSDKVIKVSITLILGKFDFALL